jgi:hypothetical protein
MQKLSVVSSACHGRGKRRDHRHARTTLCSPAERQPSLVRKPPRKTPAPPSQAGRGKFVWDHRMTGPEGRPFPGACATNLHLQGCSCFMTNGGRPDHPLRANQGGRSRRQQQAQFGAASPCPYRDRWCGFEDRLRRLKSLTAWGRDHGACVNS